jgi:hypothetical protein
MAATRPSIYGLLAEYSTPEAIVGAAARAYEAGYRRMDAYSPMPVEGLAEAIGFKRNRMALIVLIGGLSGAAIAYATMWFSAVIHYPINVGGRPLHSWPAFIPITFELTILGAASSAVLGMLGLNGLPRPHHPLFNIERFALASRNRFFLCIEATDPKFDRSETRQFLESLAPNSVTEVPLR